MKHYFLYLCNMIYEEHHPQFFTATIYEWNHLLKDDASKNIITDSLRFLVENKRVNVYAFVIMSNHLHLIWRVRNPHKLKDVQRDFLKFTAQQLKSYWQKQDPSIIEACKVGHHDRKYMIWKTDSLSVDLYGKNVFNQKLDYIHDNPVKAGLCYLREDYRYSSAAYYEFRQSEWDFMSEIEE